MPPSNPPKSKRANPSSRKQFRSKERIASDRERISQMLLDCVPKYEICEALGISYSLLSNEMHVLKNKIDVATLRNIQQAKGNAIAELENLKAAFWKCHRLSLAGKLNERVKKQAARNGRKKKSKGTKAARDMMRVVEKITTRETCSGDAAFLAGVHRCIMDIARIEGAVTEIKGDIPPLGDGSRATVIILPGKSEPRPIPPQIENIKNVTTPAV